jgi:hypothetical protein
VTTVVQARAAGAVAARHRRDRRLGRRVLRVGLLGFFMLALLMAWVVVRGLQAKSHLLRAAAAVTQLDRQAGSGDVSAQRLSLATLQREAHAARAETADPVWRAMAAVPFAGRNEKTISAVASAVDDLAVRALPPLVEASATLDLRQLAPHAGTIDIAELQRISGPVVNANDAVSQIRERVDGLPTAGLLPQVRVALAQLRAGLLTASRTTATAARAVTLLPPMLGANGPRTYAVLFLNNAELRSAGGIPGSWAILRADAGHVDIVNQGSALDVNSRLQGGVAVPPDVAAVYTNRAGTFFQDATLGPDFPSTAALASAMLQQAYGVRLDGVVATDPVALAALLKATGPVALPLGGSLTADNAVSLLLSDVYRTVPDPKQQDLFFGLAAKAVFDALSNGQGHAGAVIGSLADAADAGRLSVWSARRGEQAELAASPLAGQLPATDGASKPTIGVFLNDGTAAKLDYYLHEKVDVGAANCPANRLAYRVRITLTSAVPSSGLPAYVTGAGVPGLVSGSIRTQVYVYAPTGGAVQTATADGSPARLGAGVVAGRSVGIVTVDLAPGQTSTLDVTVLTGVVSTSTRAHDVVPGVRLTPLATPALLQVAASGCRNG